MLSLYELQKQFADGLNQHNETVLQHINFSQKLSAQKHLAIYQNSMRANLQNALKEIYPVCVKLVGEEFFIAMINQYISQTPSLQPDLGSYGKTLADFIVTFTPAGSVPYLADIARLEWAWHSIFHAADSSKLDFNKLAACSEHEGENIIFTLPSACFLLTSPYPIHQIWQMNQADYPSEEPFILPENQRFFFLVWRDGFDIRMDQPTETEWKILKWIQQNFTLGQICSQLYTDHPQTDITKILPRFAACGWLTGFTSI